MLREQTIPEFQWPETSDFICHLQHVYQALGEKSYWLLKLLIKHVTSALMSLVKQVIWLCPSSSGQESVL